MRHRKWRHFRQKKELSNRGLMCSCKEDEHKNDTLFPRIKSSWQCRHRLKSLLSPCIIAYMEFGRGNHFPESSCHETGVS